MQERLSKEITDSARELARFGLNLATAAVGYASQVLRDVEQELKVSGEKLRGEKDSSTGSGMPTGPGAPVTP